MVNAYVMKGSFFLINFVLVCIAKIIHSLKNQPENVQDNVMRPVMDVLEKDLKTV